MTKETALDQVRVLVERLDTSVDSVFDRVRGHKVADRVMYAVSELFDFSLGWHIIAAARGVRSDADADDAFRLAVTLGLESLIVNGAVKALFRRTRPAFTGERPHNLREPRTSSFPSGHASAAFCAAAWLADDNPAGAAWYLLAAVVASSRVYVKIHHASDVLAGAALGVTLGRIARRALPPHR